MEQRWPYCMREDLCYQRTPTEAKMRVTMPNGEQWDVPVQIIADDRDGNYADDEEDTVGFIKAKELGINEITDWAANNMNWDDVERYSEKVVDPATCDYQEGWVNGDKQIVGEL